MQKTVADRGLMDMPSFRVIDIETFITAVFVSATCQILVKCYNVIH